MYDDVTPCMMMWHCVFACVEAPLPCPKDDSKRVMTFANKYARIYMWTDTTWSHFAIILIRAYLLLSPPLFFSSSLFFPPSPLETTSSHSAITCTKRLGTRKWSSKKLDRALKCAYSRYDSSKIIARFFDDYYTVIIIKKNYHYYTLLYGDYY